MEFQKALIGVQQGVPLFRSHVTGRLLGQHKPFIKDRQPVLTDVLNSAGPVGGMLLKEARLVHLLLGRNQHIF